MKKFKKLLMAVIILLTVFSFSSQSFYTIVNAQTNIDKVYVTDTLSKAYQYLDSNIEDGKYTGSDNIAVASYYLAMYEGTGYDMSELSKWLSTLEYPTSANDIIKTLYGFKAVGIDYTNFHGRNLINDLLSYQKEDGRIGSSDYTDSMIVKFLYDEGYTVPKVENLLNRWLNNYEWKQGCIYAWGSYDVDTTSRILRAVVALRDSGYNIGDVWSSKIEEFYSFYNSHNSNGIVTVGYDTLTSTAEFLMFSIDEGRYSNKAVQGLIAKQENIGGWAYAGKVNPATTNSVTWALSQYYSKVNPVGDIVFSKEQLDINVSMSVTGKYMESFFNGTITIKEGQTVLDALKATGLSVEESSGWVSAINGLENSGYSGWMFKVNGEYPTELSNQYVLKEGDRVEWEYYSSEIIPTILVIENNGEYFYADLFNVNPSTRFIDALVSNEDLSVVFEDNKILSIKGIGDKGVWKIQVNGEEVDLSTYYPRDNDEIYITFVENSKPEEKPEEPSNPGDSNKPPIELPDEKPDDNIPVFPSNPGNSNNGSDSGNNSSNVSNKYNITYIVTGKNGEILYSKKLKVTKGKTVMDILKQTGLDLVESSCYVSAINGMYAEGMYGWVFEVNNQMVMVSACDYKLKDGDVVRWKWSGDNSEVDMDSLFGSTIEKVNGDKVTIRYKDKETGKYIEETFTKNELKEKYPELYEELDNLELDDEGNVIEQSSDVKVNEKSEENSPIVWYIVGGFLILAVIGVCIKLYKRD